MNRDLFRYARAARGALVGTVVAGLLIAGATIAQMSALSRVVAGVFLGHQSLGRVAPLLAALVAAIVARAGLVWLREAVAQQGAIRVKAELRERLCAHLLHLGPAYARSERTGELVTVAVEGVERLDAYVSRYLPQLALSVGVPLMIALYVLPLDWASAVLLLVTGPIIPLLMVLIGSYAQERIQSQWLALSRMGAHFLDAVQGLPTLVAFGREGAERERIAQISDAFRERTMKALRLAFLSGMVLELMAAVAIALIAVQLGVRLLDGGIAFQPAFLVLLLAPEFYRPLRELGTHRHAGMEGSAAASRIVEILSIEPANATYAHNPKEWEEAGNAALKGGEQVMPSQAAGFSPPEIQHKRVETRDWARQDLLPGLKFGVSGRRCDSRSAPIGPLTVVFENVRYAYPGSERPALDGVSLTLPAGTRTALVGRSGAGKSTLAGLLPRFIEAQEGAISVNGVPLAALPVEAWRERVALVPQRPYLFHGSVGENIRLARPEATPDEMAWAAELAGATEFIERLPRGYETMIGERGARLSAGQAQRLAIARALLKDAPLLVLDEPTSSLDPRGEALLREALPRLMHGRTVLVIAHRLNTIRDADQIAVLEAGRLAECGRHEELLRRDGPYARLLGVHAKEWAPV